MIKKRIQDQKIYDTIEKLEKNDNSLIMNDVYIQTLRALLETRALLQKVYKEIKPKKAKNITIDPLNAGPKDIVIGEIK